MADVRLSPAYIILIQKGWQAVSGFITALLVTHFLSPGEQGYYYTFASLLSGYVLLDLGLSGLLVQISARMFPGLELLPGGDIVPSGIARSSYFAMVAWSRRWFRFASFAALLLIPIGYLYFSYAKQEVLEVDWQCPWFFAVFSVAVSLHAYPVLSIVEGTGKVAEAYLVRIAHYGLGALLAWPLLVGGVGLYAPAMAPLSVAIVVLWWRYNRYRALFAASGEGVEGFPWREDIWPLQRKVALSWMSSYLFIYSPTLVVFYFHDAAVAGQLGLSIVVANILGSLCSSWLTARVPHITRLVVQGDVSKSNKVFKTEFYRAILLGVIIYTVGIIAAVLISDYNFATRILPPFQLFILFISFLVFNAMSMFAIYYRAQGREILALPALIATVVSIVASCFVINMYGVSGVLITFLSIYGIVCLSGMFFAWNYGKYRS